MSTQSDKGPINLSHRQSGDSGWTTPQTKKLNTNNEKNKEASGIIRRKEHNKKRGMTKQEG